jgi:hypothetical protein
MRNKNNSYKDETGPRRKAEISKPNTSNPNIPSPPVTIKATHL